MIPVIALVTLISSVTSEVKSYQRHVYMARNTHPNSLPINTGYYAYKQTSAPSELNVFESDINPLSYTQDIPQQNNKTRNNSKSTFKTSSYNLESRNYLEPKANSVNNIVIRYDSNHRRVDDDDVRTDSKMYGGWPFFYSNPYQYEPMQSSYVKDKAKDKRSAITNEKIIPVHEIILDDVPQEYNPSHENNVDNPIYGNQPFFSFVLNDYFDNNKEEDPLTFKGLHWGNDFDHEKPFLDIEEGKRVRRLDDNKIPYKSIYDDNDKQSVEHLNRIAETESGFNKYNTQGGQAKGEKESEDHSLSYSHEGQNSMKLKDFLDSFVNKFGSEGHGKDTNYSINKTQDKGENKKGFRRVYHKDEYQEDNEFFDNSSNKSKLEETGGSKINVGASEGLLGSRAFASTGSNANSLNKKGNAESQKFLNKNEIENKSTGADKDYYKYHDIAHMARTNNDDYF
ncbi:uncharacterized protein LOC126975543 [Leptidea sinapis]|uniref:uncharacterized protein LOC126975543 n=1 Tax=Leptidea sinapis TaxID=189913 RepID=UPI002122F444|nr:uncharacterized protein LOC126975543 [Leptidea sinapis]